MSDRERPWYAGNAQRWWFVGSRVCYVLVQAADAEEAVRLGGLQIGPVRIVRPAKEEEIDNLRWHDREEAITDGVPEAVVRWSDGAVWKLAQAIVADRRWADEPILADALENAGHANASVLLTLRGRGGLMAHDLVRRIAGQGPQTRKARGAGGEVSIECVPFIDSLAGPRPAPPAPSWRKAPVRRRRPVVLAVVAALALTTAAVPTPFVLPKGTNPWPPSDGADRQCASEPAPVAPPTASPSALE